MAEALKLVREDVCWLEDHFAHWAKDTEWLPVVGASGWLVVMRDKKVRTRPGERQAIIDHRVGCFILNQGSDPTKWEYLKLLALTLDAMLERFEQTARPFIFTVNRDGDMSQVLK